MSKFWVQGGSETEEENSDYDQDDDNPSGNETNVKDTVKSDYLIKKKDNNNDIERDADDSHKRVVKSQKDKRCEEYTATIDQMKNSMKINDWVSVQECFDKINRQLDKVMRVTESVKAPKLYIRALVYLGGLLESGYGE